MGDELILAISGTCYESPEVTLFVHDLLFTLTNEKGWIQIGNQEFAKINVGDCPTGVDKAVREWCADRLFDHEQFEASWRAYGKIAGPMRNQQLVLASDFLLAFPMKNASAGTGDAIAKCRYQWKPMLVLPIEQPSEAT